MKTVKSLSILLLLLTAHSLLSTASELGSLWQLSGFMAPESVVYDENNGVLYVSNINGQAMEKDGNGFISKVSLKGELLELKWIDTLHAPKGLAIHNGTLYVSDIDALVEIDIESASIKHRHIADGAKLLNDVTVRKNGEVFVSDMMTDTIHSLNQDHFSIWLQDKALSSPNGLHAGNEYLAVASWGIMTDGFATDVPGHIKTVSYDDKKITSLGNGRAIGNLDGIEVDHDNYLVTDWMAGKLFRIFKNGETELMLQLEQGMADHEWIADKLMILLPMMKSDKLLAYTIKP